MTMNLQLAADVPAICTAILVVLMLLKAHKIL